MTPGEIHDEHPFATPPELRSPVRQFRGRMPAPVTIVTAGSGPRRAGLTVSSVIVAEGEPSYVHLLVGTTADLWDAIQETERFIVHVLEVEHRSLSDRFAGIRPSPGGLFADLETEETAYGPALAAVRSRALCRYVGHRDDPLHALVHGEIDAVQLHDLRQPLRYFRGEYFHG